MTAQSLSAADDIDFNRDVRPILSEHCFTCHGPDPKSRKAELRLDTREGLFGDRGGYVAVAAKNLDESELFARVTSDDADLRMPPTKHGKGLAKAEIETLRRWIAGGARWQGHWAYVVPMRPDLPKSAGENAHPVDAFVQAMLQSRKMQVSPPTDKVTLIRRVTYDLTGLPTTPAQVQEFVNDNRPDAYAQLVDRLLRSPAYGERMAMFWLDLVRYADTNGIHGDNHRDIWLYRDYVIKAFQQNKPFDEFTREQIAGDLLEDVTDETRIASGYNRLLMTTREGGAQAKEYLAKYAADRVRNASTVWLGGTLGCAECHDHKFDPYTAKDFYSFAAFFADIRETPVGQQPQTKFPTADQSAELEKIDAQIKERTQQLTNDTPAIVEARQTWERETLQKLSQAGNPWQIVRPTTAVSSGKATLVIQNDHSVLSTGANPAKDTYTVDLPLPAGTVAGLRLEALLHPSLANNGLSRGNGNFVLTRFELANIVDDKPAELKIASAVADHEQPTFPVKNALDGKANTGWAISGYTDAGRGHNRTAVFTLKQPLVLKQPGTLRVTMRHESQYAQHNIGRFRLSVTSEKQPSLNGQLELPADVIAALKTAANKRKPSAEKRLAEYYRSVAPELNSVRESIKKLEAQRKSIENAFPQTLVTTAQTPRTMRILPRGNWLDDSGPEVQPAVPVFLTAAALRDGRATRLDLANWLVDDKNPLTARVFVNRLWKLFHGRGLVSTLDDFGSQGAAPSHPQLLDWLAVEFRESGWDVQHLVRIIVSSKTYQQSSEATAGQLQVDPFNIWLARQSRWRHDAETIRDTALAVSGLLAREVGGPSVKPYQPAGYWKHLNFPKRQWKVDTGSALYRRGLYTYWCRTFLHPGMLAFDAATREECTVERPRSNTPLQALVLLNDPSYVEAARALAERTLAEAASNEANAGSATDKRLTAARDTVRIDWLFETVLSREGQADEIAVLRELLASQREIYRNDITAAEQFLKVGARPGPKDVAADELAAWTQITRVFLNLHETITRR